MGSLGHSAAEVEAMPIVYGLAVIQAARLREARQVEVLAALFGTG